jgi:hypothetical protein
MIAGPSLFISEGVMMNSMCHWPAVIGIYIVQTDGQSWPFIVKFGWEWERRQHQILIF